MSNKPYLTSGAVVKNFGVIFVLFGVIQCCYGQDFVCCSHATGSCRSVCEKETSSEQPGCTKQLITSEYDTQVLYSVVISLVNIAADRTLREQTLIDVQKYCSFQLNQFWECLNATFKEISYGESWSGRVCCPLPQSITCRTACVTATSSLDLMQSCRQSDEIAFYSCLERQSLGDSCCYNAGTDDCKEACYDIFKSHLTPTKQQRNKAFELCEHTSPKVWNCVKNFTKVTPATNLHKYMKCCDKSNKSKCRETCSTIFSATNTLQEIIDGLQIGGCGPPLPQEPIWQCFMQPTEPISTSIEVSRIERVGMDSAKWHCCQMASSSLCKKLCSKTFTKDWASWEEFHSKCFSQISEENLRTCIDEVDKPCELGCDGLSFCTNFNNRPTELFRSCNSQADENARYDVEQWQNQRELYLPGLKLPLKNITQCSPNLWKAVACTIHIKPCSRYSHGNQICRDVCLNILGQCVDWSSMITNDSPESVCATLSPESPDASCITLDSFLSPPNNGYLRVNGQVSSPCKGDPCEENEFCSVNKNCIPGMNCIPYICTPGCKLGEISDYTVPEGTYVRIPIPNHPKGCLKICRCTDGKITDCQLLPCVNLVPCWIGKSQKDHGVVFDMECNFCSCYAGEIVCSKKQCENTALSGRNTAYTTLPCNCPPHYVPVCGRNGNNYPSLCLAKCAGLSDSDIEYEACQDPCKNNPCPIGQKCVPDTKVCLSLLHKPCPQYQCINGSTKCSNYPKDPVCDIGNIEYSNACLLAHNNAKLAYRGPCLKNCKHKGEVCGINGKTYISECAALADYVSVDYEGPCAAIGLITEKKNPQCSSIKCKPLPDPDCQGVTPPGACCPICGGALRLLYSRKQIDRALYALKEKVAYPLTLKALLKALERQIQVAQCDLRGYLSVELDIFVVVHTTERYPSALQLEACMREAEKIASLVNRQSPRIVSELSLSSLMAANVVHTQENSCSHLLIHVYLFVVCFVLSRLF